MIFVKAVFAKDGFTQVSSVNDPILNSGDILVELKSCGICGSDIEKIFGKYGKTSMRLGHEPAGVVIAVGDDVKNLKVGDRVFTHHHVACLSCHLCKNGSETLCEKYSSSNLEPCGLSEKYVVPKWNVDNGGVLKLPDSMSFDEAALIEPLGCCIRAWNKITHNIDLVGIFGVGPTGLMHAMLAQDRGCKRMFCLDTSDFRLNFIKKFVSADTINATDPDRLDKIHASCPMGLDLSLVATSSMQALSDAISATRKGGTVMMFGVPSKGAMLNIDMSEFYSKEITLLTSYAASDVDTKQALELINSGFRVKDIITHRFNLNDSNDAFTKAKQGSDSMKIIIYHS